MSYADRGTEGKKVKSWGFQEVEAPRFEDSRHMKMVRMSALRAGHLYPPFPRKYSGYSFLLETESTAEPEGCQLKIPMTPSGMSTEQ